MATYAVPSGDRIWAGRDVVLPDPDDVSFTWPPGVNCTIPDAEGVNAPIHPKVLDFGSSGWNGYRYWMAYTPYPNAANNDLLENPCVVASNDGDTWVAPAENPIVSAPTNAAQGVVYNHDPHLTYKDGVLYLFWGFYDGTSGRYKRLDYKTTTDGVNWSATQNLFTNNSGEDTYWLSPCLEYFDGKWWWWDISHYSTPYRLMFRTAESLYGEWTEREVCTLSLSGGKNMWHHDVVRIPNGWALLLCEESGNRVLWFAVSRDGKAWTRTATPLSEAQPGMYRPSLVRSGAGFDCWLTDFDARKIRRLRLNLGV